MKQTYIKNFVLQNGERYCLLLDAKTHLPLFYPNLYLTTQVRNKSLSLSAMVSALVGIQVLHECLREQGICLEKRFSEYDFLKIHELDAIRDYCQKKFKTSKRHLFQMKSRSPSAIKVSKESEYSRLSSIAAYTQWLASILCLRRDKNVSVQVGEMVAGLKSRRPFQKRKNESSHEDKALDEKQIHLVFEVFRPGSQLNPFEGGDVQVRNRLIFLILFHLGIRGGELLNIRIRDFDFSKNHLVVARRADEKKDTRVYQPLVKTLDRRLPLKETLSREVHDYVVKIRKKIPNANRHDFLFVTHKSGPTQGQPLSISAYKKIIETVRLTSPDLANLTGHKLRHTWNDLFSKKMDAMEKIPSEENQEQIRSYLMGWKDGSGTAAIYNKRFIKNKAHEASLQLQEKVDQWQ